MPDIASLTFIGYNPRKKATVPVRVANVDETTLDATISGITDLVTAYQGISSGVLNHRTLTLETQLATGLPVNPDSQRERRWRVSYQDITQNLAAGVANPYYGEKFSVFVPCANLTTAMLLGNTDYADLTNGDIADFVTAFEAAQKSPTGGSVQVLEMKHIPRRG